MSDALESLPSWASSVVADMTPRLAAVGGVRAVVLGGSYARLRGTPTSDLDLAVLYDVADPLDLAALQLVIDDTNDTLDVQPSPLGGWGPWVNGGAWLHIDGHPVDILYRSVDRYDATIAAAIEGFAEHDWLQQPPFGFVSPIYLGEIDCCVALHDPNGVVGRLKSAVRPYPPALRANLVRGYHWGATFSLMNAEKPAKRGDIYAALGCCTRAVSFLVQVLLAHNEVYPISDKGVIDEIAGLHDAPDDWSARIATALAVGSSAPTALLGAVASLRELVDEVRVITGLQTL